MFKKQDGHFKNIKISDIFPDENITKRYCDEYELFRLKDSIKENGVIEPILVRRHGSAYILIAGERRLRAAKIAGMKKVPCIVYNTDAANSAIYSVIENMQKSPISIFEEAERINRIITEYGIPHSDIAARLGITQSALANKLRLLKIGERLRKRITAAALTERHARLLIRVPENYRAEILDYVIANNLSVNDTEIYIDSFLKSEHEKPNDKQGDKKTAIGDIRIFSNSLTRLVETLNSSGIEAKHERRDFRDHIEYRIKIPKENRDSENASQLKIC